MIPVCLDATRPAGTDFTLRLHGEIIFQSSNAEQFSTCYLCRFVYIFIYFPLQTCAKLLCHPAKASWSDYMGKFRPGKAESRQYNRGTPHYRDVIVGHNLWRVYNHDLSSLSIKTANTKTCKPFVKIESWLLLIVFLVDSIVWYQFNPIQDWGAGGKKPLSLISYPYNFYKRRN